MVLIIYYGIFIRVDYKIREGNKIIFDNINDLKNANDANVALKEVFGHLYGEASDVNHFVKLFD